MSVNLLYQCCLKRNEHDDYGSDGNAALKLAHDIFDPIDSNLVNHFMETDPTRTLDIAHKLLLYANSIPDQDNNAADIVNIRNYITAEETKDVWLEQLDAWALAQQQQQAGSADTDINNAVESTTDDANANDANANDANANDANASGANANMADSIANDNEANNLNSGQLDASAGESSMDYSQTNSDQNLDGNLNSVTSNPAYQEAVFYLDGVITNSEIQNQFSQNQNNSEHFVLMIQRYQADHFTLTYDDNRQLMHQWIVEQHSSGQNWIQKVQAWFNEYYDSNGVPSILTSHGHISSQVLRDRFNDSYAAIAEELGPNVVIDNNIDYNNPENLKFRAVTSLNFIDVVTEYRLMGQMTEYWQKTLGNYQQKLQSGQASDAESRDIPVIQNIIQYNLDGKHRMAELATGLQSGQGYVLQLSADDFQSKATSTRTVVSMCTEFGERWDPRTIAIYYAGTQASPDRIAEINKYIRENPMTWYFDFYQMAGGGGAIASGGNSGSDGGPDWGGAFDSGNPFDGLNSIQQQFGLGGQTLTTREADYNRWHPTGQTGAAENGNGNGTSNTVDPRFLEVNGVDQEVNLSPIVFQTRNGNVTTTYTLEYNDDGTVSTRAVDETDSFETIRFREINESPVSLPSGLTARQIDRLFLSESALSDFLKLSPEYQETYANDPKYFDIFVLGHMVSDTFKIDISKSFDLSADLTYNDYNRVKRIIDNPALFSVFDQLNGTAKAELIERVVNAKRIQISSDSAAVAAQQGNLDVIYTSDFGIDDQSYWTGVVNSYLLRQNESSLPLADRTSALTMFSPQVPQELSKFVFPLEVMGADGTPRHAGTVSVFQVQTSEGIKYGYATNAHTMLQGGELIGYDGKPIELGPNGFVPFVSLPNGQRILIPTEGGTSIIYGRNNAGAPDSNGSNNLSKFSGDLTIGLAGANSPDMENFIAYVVPENLRGQIPELGGQNSISVGAQVVQVGVPGYINQSANKDGKYILVGSSSTVTANNGSVDGTIRYSMDIGPNNFVHSGGSSGGPVYQISTVVDPATGATKQVYTIVAINAFIVTNTNNNIQTSGGPQIIADPNSSIGFVLPSTLMVGNQNSGGNDSGGAGGG